MESQKQKMVPKKTDELHIKRPVPRSKSASISTKLKTPAVPRSKSANIRQAANGIEKARSQGIASKPVHTSNGTINVQNTAILTNIELDEYKNMNSGQSVGKNQSQGKIHSAERLQRPLKSGNFLSFYCLYLITRVKCLIQVILKNDLGIKNVCLS